MKYSCEITIGLPRDRVAELFHDQANLAKWQDGLQSFEPVSGDPGQVGATSRIRYKMGKREVEMIETITEIDAPERFSATYEADKVWNLVENTFTDRGETTHWRVDTEFRCGGFIAVMAFLLPGMFKKQTRKMMTDFKTFAEAER